MGSGRKMKSVYFRTFETTSGAEKYLRNQLIGSSKRDFKKSGRVSSTQPDTFWDTYWRFSQPNRIRRVIFSHFW